MPMVSWAAAERPGVRTDPNTRRTTTNRLCIASLLFGDRVPILYLSIHPPVDVKLPWAL
jgi:hypothetical protein